MTQTNHTPAAKTFTMAMKDAFGGGKKPVEFMKEMKNLSDEDKAWYSAELTKAGIEHTPPMARSAGTAAAAAVEEVVTDKPAAVAA